MNHYVVTTCGVLLALSSCCIAATQDGNDLLRQYDDIAHRATTPEASTTQRRALLNKMSSDEFDAFIRSFVAANAQNRDLRSALVQLAEEYHRTRGGAVAADELCLRASLADTPWQWRFVLLNTWRPPGQQWPIDLRKRVYESLTSIVVDVKADRNVAGAAFDAILRLAKNDWQELARRQPRIGAAVRADGALDESEPLFKQLPADLSERVGLLLRTLGDVRSGLERLRASGSDPALYHHLQATLDQCLGEIRSVPTTAQTQSSESDD